MCVCLSPTHRSNGYSPAIAGCLCAVATALLHWMTCSCVSPVFLTYVMVSTRRGGGGGAGKQEGGRRAEESDELMLLHCSPSVHTLHAPFPAVHTLRCMRVSSVKHSVEDGENKLSLFITTTGFSTALRNVRAAGQVPITSLLVCE